MKWGVISEIDRSGGTDILGSLNYMSTIFLTMREESMVTGVVRSVDFTDKGSPEGREIIFKTDGSPAADTLFSYPKLPIVVVVLPIVEMVEF